MEAIGIEFWKAETSMAEKKRTSNGGEVFISVPAEEPPKGAKGPSAVDAFQQESLAKPSAEPGGSATGASAKAVSPPCPSPEISRSSPSKPPKIPTANETLTRRKSLARSMYSKPKSRFGEQPYPLDSNVLEETTLALQEHAGAVSPIRNSFNKSGRSIENNSANSVTLRTSLMASPGHPEEDEDLDIIKKVEQHKGKRRRVGTKVLIQLVVFTWILGVLVAALSIERMENVRIWSLQLWKWTVLLTALFCGMWLTHWFMLFVVFMIEKNFLLRKKVLYFVHGLKKSVQVFIWIGLVLLTWVLLFRESDVERSKVETRVLDKITWTIVSIQIASFLWLLKTLLLKILASNFHMDKFFDRIQESVFHQYVLQTLSGPPLVEQAEMVGRSRSFAQFSFRTTKKGKKEKEKKVIDMGKFHKMKRERVSAWTMKVLVDAVMTSGLSSISNTLDESAHDEGGEEADKEITNEMEAIATAYHIFRNVAQPCSRYEIHHFVLLEAMCSKPPAALTWLVLTASLFVASYIDVDDLLRFMIKEEVALVFPLLEGAEPGKIDRKSLTNWVIKVYKDRKALAHALTDTKTAVRQLHKLVTGILIIVSIVIWLLLMEIATTKVLLFLSSQLVVAAFMFGNTCKTIFEAIIFVFVMHPFDVGDLCVVDGVQLMVEEMNILTTVFLKLDKEKVYYPNSVLATKPISNYYRSPDMGDTVEFSIDFTTPLEKIGMLKEKIKKYLEGNPQHWHPNHSVVVKAIEDVNKIKMALYCNHTMNFQEFGEKNKRRTELLIELKRIFEELDIRYNLLPQRLHLSLLEPESTGTTGRS